MMSLWNFPVETSMQRLVADLRRFSIFATRQGVSKSFPAFGTRLWNRLHEPDWRKLTKRAFKRKVHKLLLTLLEIEDYYVDAHSLILN